MRILGLNHGEINSSASILIDEKKILGALEERFTRDKRERPSQSSRVILEDTRIHHT